MLVAIKAEAKEWLAIGGKVGCSQPWHLQDYRRPQHSRAEVVLQK
jgi:hypothetical protein